MQRAAYSPRFRPRNFAWPFALLLCLACLGCGDDGAQSGASTESGGTGTEAALPELRPCEIEEDCDIFGPGQMCLSGACVAMSVVSPAVEIDPATEASLMMAPLTDLNPDPMVFEGELLAQVATLPLRPGQSTEVYSYVDAHAPRASLPGPVIDVPQGAKIRINLYNQLPEETTIHWHGVRVPDHMDGVPGQSQQAVPPGFAHAYEFVAHDPGIFLYRPDISFQLQQERGLFGLIRVHPNVESGPAVNRTRSFVFSDVKLDANGQIARPSSQLFEAELGHDGRPLYRFESVMGRHGNRLLINGKSHPIIHVKSGHIERWQFANAAGSRFFNVGLSNHRFTRISRGGDLQNEPTRRMKNVVMANGERVEVIVQFHGQPGSQHLLFNRFHTRGHDMTSHEDQVLALVVYDPEPASDGLPFPDFTAGNLMWMPEQQPTRKLLIDKHRSPVTEALHFTVNGFSHPQVPLVQAHVGGYEVWEVENQSDVDQSFHLHGTRFMPLYYRGVASPPPGATPGETPGVDPEFALGALQFRGPGHNFPWTRYPQPLWQDTLRIPAYWSVQIGVYWSGYPGQWSYESSVQDYALAGLAGRVRVDIAAGACAPGQVRCRASALERCEDHTNTWLPGVHCPGGCDANTQPPTCLE